MRRIAEIEKLPGVQPEGVGTARLQLRLRLSTRFPFHFRPIADCIRTDAKRREQLIVQGEVIGSK
jgi:hypothetical protein